MIKFTYAAIVAALTAGSAPAAYASVVLSDNFNSYAFAGNWQPQSLWTAPGPGTVDLIGETTTGKMFDFLPGNGGYVDLDGSNGVAGTLETVQFFGAGKYTLTFDLAGNQRGDVAEKTTTISLGGWTTKLPLASSSPYTLYTYTFTTTGGRLSFVDDNAGDRAIGNILDNVTLSTAAAAGPTTLLAIPEPSTWVMMMLGFAGLSYAGYRRARAGSAGHIAQRICRRRHSRRGSRAVRCYDGCRQQDERPASSLLRFKSSSSRIMERLERLSGDFARV
jgi:PEP-CTERM motif-containing protein